MGYLRNFAIHASESLDEYTVGSVEGCVELCRSSPKCRAYTMRNDPNGQKICWSIYKFARGKHWDVSWDLDQNVRTAYNEISFHTSGSRNPGFLKLGEGKVQEAHPILTTSVNKPTSGWGSGEFYVVLFNILS